MKKIYWRPSSVPRRVLVILAILAIATLLSVELIKVKKKQPYYKEKIQAAQIMKEGMETIKQYRLKYVGPIDLEIDPAGSGMIGLAASPITSSVGYLHVKQTTINPNWAAVLVEMLKEAGAKEGNVIAANFSGSFPALNLATFAAAETLGLKVIAISSAAASNFGANNPQLTWLDMERILYENGITSHRSVAASLGGQDDRALGMSAKSREILHSIIDRNKVKIIEKEGLKESIDERMAVYTEHARGERIAVYVNVGGGSASVGPVTAKRAYKPGLNRKPPPRALRFDSVMNRFARERIPVIHLVYIDKLAEQYGMPKSPSVTPNIGEGEFFVKIKYNLYLAAANLLILILLLYICLRLDIGYRIFGSEHVAKAPKHPEPMV